MGWPPNAQKKIKEMVAVHTSKINNQQTSLLIWPGVQRFQEEDPIYLSWGAGALGPWGLGALRPGGLGALGPGALGALGALGPGALEPEARGLAAFGPGLRLGAPERWEPMMRRPPKNNCLSILVGASC